MNAPLCLVISNMALRGTEKWDTWDLWLYANEKKKKKDGFVIKFSCKRAVLVITFSYKRKEAAEDTYFS